MRFKVLLVVAFVVLMLLLIRRTGTEHPSSQLTDNNSTASDTAPVQRTSPASSAFADEIISVDATSLIAAYQTDEKAATARYENRKLAVTGVLSGFFTTSLGFADTALVTMGESHPLIIDETLRIPGISAYSKGSLLFGLRDPHALADRLRVGKTVTLVCTARDPMPVSATPLGIIDHPEYRVILRDCTLQTAPNEAAVSKGSANPRTTPRAVEGNDPVDSYQPCPQATQPLRVPEQIDLDEPADFSSSKEPPPQFTFLFSEHGVDVYAVRTNKFGPAGYDRLALLVFQDEKVRRDVLRTYITSGLVQWAYSDTGVQDWKPIVNFKYVTLDFGWLQRDTGWEPWVKSAVFYAPPACNSVSEPPGARPSSMIGIYISASPSELPHDSLRYRAAQALWKFQMQERSK
jgi:hypothetical protein